MIGRTLIQVAGCLGAFALSAGAQSTVTTSGTTSSGTVPVFNGTATVTNSPISVSGGNVGVGVTSPGATLTVGPYANSTTHYVVFAQTWDATSGYANFVGGWNSPAWWGIGPLDGTGDNTLRIGNVASSGAQYAGTWASTQNLNLVIGGNVGIGTTSPAQKLEVNGYIQTDAGIYFPGNSTPQTQPYTGTTCGGDYAESMDVTGDRTKYAPGDVLVLDSDNPGKILKSIEPYSTAVAGIYSNKPGTVGRRQLTPKSDTEVPMAMIGVVPAKVTTENGSIKIGDLLVSSSKSGYAMKGTDRSRMLGAVIGKAMSTLDSGTGTIEVLVTLQ